MYSVHSNFEPYLTQGYVHLMMGVGAEATLMRGFTTVRDAGGSPFGLKRAIDEGSIPGPRIYPSGLIISQTGGHADSRKVNEPNRYVHTYIGRWAS